MPTITKTQNGITYEAAGEAGMALLEKFDRAVPYVKKMARICERQAKRNGYIKTLSGRRCRFPLNAASEVEWAHKALNRLIQ